MRIMHAGSTPVVHPEAYVSPAAVLCGDVRIGAESRVLHGAVLTADGGPLAIGRRCVVMEGAVLRSTRKHPLVVGDSVLIGPHAYLTGCRVDDEVFIATGAMVFNGAVMGRASSMALGGAVHIGCRVPPEERIPIDWVSVGDPARLYPPTAVEDIRAGLTEAGGFLPFVFGVPDTGDRGQICGSRWLAPFARWGDTTTTSSSTNRLLRRRDSGTQAPQWLVDRATCATCLADSDQQRATGWPYPQLDCLGA